MFDRESNLTWSGEIKLNMTKKASYNNTFSSSSSQGMSLEDMVKSLAINF